jgi:hypothetical protein
MKHEDAEAAAAKLNEEHPERDHYQWFAKGEDGDWSVARMRLPHARSSRPPTATTQAKQPGPPPDEHPLDLPGGMKNYGV